MAMARISKREQEASKAKTRLALVIAEAAEESGLTDVEYLQVLTDLQQSRLRYMLRYERHGNYDKPAGLE